MITNIDLKIAWRSFLNNKWYNILNITGLSLGLAAFVFVTLYVNNETSYDQWNKNIDRVFLVERELPNGPSPYTPGKLAALIKSTCPEVEAAGRINTAPFQIPFYTPAGRFMIKNWVGADYSIAQILGIEPKGFTLDQQNPAPTVLLSPNTARVLFPADTLVRNKTINMMSRTGMPMPVSGVAKPAPGNTSLSFDCIGFNNDITQGKDQSVANQIYQTYLMLRPGADVGLLSKKIDKLYKDAVLADTSRVAKEAIHAASMSIYLDPLKNLHLKPHYGSHVNNQIVNGLIALASIILVITGINFTNLYVSQATRRSKEVGVKKVNGIQRGQIVIQFLAEIFIQCLAAYIIALLLVKVGLPYFNESLNVNLKLSGIDTKIITQLSATLLVLTILAGTYPALVMGNFKPIEVLRNNQFTNKNTFAWLRGAVTALQFTFAIGFVIILVIINQQVTFMKLADPGFKAGQVIYVDNLGIYNDPAKFEDVSTRIAAIPGVKNVTVASTVPGGIIPATYEYEVLNKAYDMHTIGVGYNYFETLNMPIKQGNAFSSTFAADSTNAVINETAVKAMGLTHPIGALIHGRGGNYRVIGVVKDAHAYGYETGIQPTIYLLKDGQGINRTQIMISAQTKAIPSMLKTLHRQWSSINKLDGDNFNYHFLDELYGHLFVKQEQLQFVLMCFSALAVFIAALGIFASSAQAIHSRMKEVAIRKVFGANGRQIMATLSRPFIILVLISNLIAWPLASIIAGKWLETFAYRVDVSITPFVIAMVISAGIVLITVCMQIVRAAGFNPAARLKI